MYTAPAFTEERHREIEQRFGARVVIGYGLSESPYGAIWPRGETPYGSMGRLRQHPELGEINTARIVNAEGLDVADGETGELLLKNPAVMRGYFAMPEETAVALEGGWLHTGDLVYEDRDGYLHFVSRKKHVIRRRGENLSPAEVEAVLDACPAVVESAVIGVASELSDEDVKAFVIPFDHDTTAAELWEWCAARLARFKVPRYIEFVGGTAAHSDPANCEGTSCRDSSPAGSTIRSLVPEAQLSRPLRARGRRSPGRRPHRGPRPMSRLRARAVNAAAWGSSRRPSTATTSGLRATLRTRLP